MLYELVIYLHEYHILLYLKVLFFYCFQLKFYKQVAKNVHTLLESVQGQLYEIYMPM